MATIAQLVSVPTPQELAAAEAMLSKIFLDNLYTLSQDRQREIIAELRVNAAAHDE